MDNPEFFHGFVPSCSKTDNFKVKGKEIPPKITIRKFIDCNFNGTQDAGEDDYEGWGITVFKPSGEVAACYTTCVIDPAETGDWAFQEDLDTDDWVQTALYIDGDKIDPPNTWASLTVYGYDEETHEVVYGNAPNLCIKAYKFYDRNNNGKEDGEEGPVSGIRISLEVEGSDGWELVAEGCTGAGGYVEFCGLLPGKYRITEDLPGPETGCDWYASTDLPVQQEVTLTCDGGPKTVDVLFGNYITGTADFDTKGAWHNKGHLDDLEWGFVDGYVNTLDPYDGVAEPGECDFDYFGVGEEPFDGVDENLDPVPGAFNDDGSNNYGLGTWQAEVSYFLIDSNADSEYYGHREQLAQQLLAFIFNVQYRLHGPATIIYDGEPVSTSDLIDAAILAWCSGTNDERDAIQEMLNDLNNDDSLEYILDGPGSCPGTCEPLE